jgi:hypothetical protein
MAACAGYVFGLKLHKLDPSGVQGSGQKKVQRFTVQRFKKFGEPKEDGLVKNIESVMPDLIRHPELIEFAGFRGLPQTRSGGRRKESQRRQMTFYDPASQAKP